MARDGRVLTEAQLVALERAQGDKEANGEFESECPGYCGAQDTFSVGTLKGVGRFTSEPSSTPTRSRVSSREHADLISQGRRSQRAVITHECQSDLGFHTTSKKSVYVRVNP